MIDKQQVIDALAELRINRPRDQADRHIRNLLRTYGNGANSIGELKLEFFEAVFKAAGGVVSTADHFGTITDVERAEDHYGVLTDVEAPPIRPLRDPRNGHDEPPPPPIVTRPRSPLAADLEARLAARAGKPRSKPNHVVNYGNPGRSEDQADDIARDFPAGERMS